MRRLMRGAGLAATLAVGLLVAACGGGANGTGGTSSTTGGGTTATKSASGGGGQAARTGVNTVSFTASGGLSGLVTLRMNLNNGNTADMISYHLASEKRFYVDLTDSSGSDRQQFILDFGGYTGPGTYTVNPVQAGAAADEAVHFELIVPGSSLGNNLWLIDKSAPGSCTVVVTSVTPVAHLANEPSAPPSHPTSGISEVQGTIACPSVPVYVADGTPPLSVSDGHFDILMAEQQ